MRMTVCMLSAVLMLGGCQQVDENPNWSPETEYPSWAYDRPFYYRPSEELPVAETVGDGIPVYYSGSTKFFVKHPAGYQVPREPRVALWCSVNGGRNWERGGFFGVEQTHFQYLAESDGRYWIRFVGPGQEPIRSLPGKPNRIYVVDTAAPTIQLSLDPPTVERDEEGNVIDLHVYQALEDVTLKWQVQDVNLDIESIQVSTTFANRPEQITWSPFPAEMSNSSGEIAVRVPPEASKPEGGTMRFRVEARDRAGNVSFALSELMYVGKVSMPVGPPAAQPASPLIVQSDGEPGDKPGWPVSGELIRGGTSRVLAWLPQEVKNYEHVELQFSANNGRSWRTVAENLQAGKAVKWHVPEVDSKICGLRVVALETIDGQERKIMLASSLPFTVHTAPPVIHLGPEELPPEPEPQ